MAFLWLMILVHWLHVLAGMIFIGVYVMMTLVVWPYLLRQPAAEARAAMATMEKPLGLMMATSGQLLLWLGLLRGTYFGPITSFDTLIHTSYGHTFLLALVVFIAVIAHSGASRARFDQRVWDRDQYRPGAAGYVRRQGTITLLGLAIILTCMVLMRFGL